MEEVYMYKGEGFRRIRDMSSPFVLNNKYAHTKLNAQISNL